MIPRQYIMHLVASDVGPDLYFRFPGVDLSLYDSVMAVLKRNDGTEKTHALAVHPTDFEIGRFAFSSNDLSIGEHILEFRFVSDSVEFTLPMLSAICVIVRARA